MVHQNPLSTSKSRTYVDLSFAATTEVSRINKATLLGAMRFPMLFSLSPKFGLQSHWAAGTNMPRFGSQGQTSQTRRRPRPRIV